MSGIFPDGGVAKSVNSINNPLLAAGCDALWYALNCRTMFDPAQSNAVISEILNATEQSNVKYDCDSLDNLAQAIRIHGIQYSASIGLPQDPYLITQDGSQVVKRGSFTVPNTYNRDIHCLAVCHLTLGAEQLIDGEDITVQLTLSTDASYDGRLARTSLILTQDATNNIKRASFQTTKTTFLNIPAGGRNFFFSLETNASADNAWRLFQDAEGMKYRFFGTSTHTLDQVVENI